MNAAVVICDTPIATNVPGFRSGEHSAGFPFWGQYYCLDFSVASLAATADLEVVVVTVERNRDTVQRLLRRYTRLQAKVLTVEAGKRALASAIKTFRARTTLLAATSGVALFDGKRLMHQYQPGSDRISRVKIGRSQLDTYIGTTDACLTALAKLSGDEMLSRGPSNSLSDLFGSVLPAAATSDISVEGRAMFGGNVRDLHSEHLWFVDNIQTDELQTLCHPLAGVTAEAAAGGDAYISAEAVAKNAVIGPRCQVKGTVERSFLFPDCTVAAGSRVVNSVIMSGNRIGPGAEIVNSLVFPSDEREPNPLRAAGGREGTTIGEKSKVGRLPSNVANIDFPRQIRGLTVIGMNPNIPAHMQVESGCYIGADVPAATLTANLKLASGTSIFANGAHRA